MFLIVSYKSLTLESACFQVDVDLTPEYAVDVQTIHTSRGLIFAFSSPKDPQLFSPLWLSTSRFQLDYKQEHMQKHVTKRKNLRVNRSICWKIPAKFCPTTCQCPTWIGDGVNTTGEDGVLQFVAVNWTCCFRFCGKGAVCARSKRIGGADCGFGKNGDAVAMYPATGGLEPLWAFIGFASFWTKGLREIK